MTPSQKRLARHALGFDQGVKQSYRNRYFAAPGTEPDREWIRMCKAGMARRSRMSAGESSRFFYLTPAGAAAALRPGESLCPEDFPQ